MIRLLYSIGSIQVAILLVNLGRAKVLSVVLGPAGFGIVATIDQVVISVVQLAGIGLPLTSLKFLSHSHSEGIEAFRSSYVSFLRAMASLSLLALGFALLLLLVRPGAFGSDLAPYRGYLAIAMLTVPALMLNIFFAHALASARRPVSSALVNLVFIGLAATGACVGVALGGIHGLYSLTVAGGAFASVGTLLYLRASAGLRLRHPSAGLLRELKKYPQVVSFSLFLYAATSAYSLAMLFTRYFVLSAMGEAAAGLLQASIAIALSLGAVFGPMSILYLTPLVNRKAPADVKLGHAHEFQARITLLLLLVSLPVVLFPKLALTVLFSTEFIGAAPLMFLFVLWQCIHQLANVYQQVLIGLDDVQFYAVAVGAGYALVAVLSPLAIPPLGLAGAAAALILGVLTSATATAIRLQVKFDAAIPARIWLCFALLLGSIVLAGAIFARIPEWSAIGVSARVLYGGTVLTLAWFLFPTRQGLFRSLLNGFRRT